MNRITLTIGSTLTLTAPVNATELTLGGNRGVFSANVQDGTATFSATETEQIPPGNFRTQWKIVAPNGDVSFSMGPEIETELPLSTNPTQPQTPNEKMLAAAYKALENASGSTAISVSTGENSFSFETRDDLLSFITRLETRIRKAKRGTPFGTRRMVA